MTYFTHAQLRTAMKTAADRFESGDWVWRQDGRYGYHGPDRPDEGSYCAVGGCGKALQIGPSKLSMSLFRILDKCAGTLFPDHDGAGMIFSFNDAPDTAKADVIAVLRCGAES